MSLSPLVSVIVPCYNHAQYVEACLESIAQSDYPNLELIFIDDGSKDDSFTIAQKWCSAHEGRFSRVFMRTQENLGVCKTLNKLVQEATGEFIVLIAADDKLTNNGITKRVEYLLEYDDVWAVFADAVAINQTDDVLAPSFLKSRKSSFSALKNSSFIAAELILNWNVAGPTLCVRKCAYDPVDGIGPYREDLYAEDRQFYLGLLSVNRLRFLDEKVAYYRIVNSSMSNAANNRLKLFQCWVRVDEVYLSKFMRANKFFLRVNLYLIQSVLALELKPTLAARFQLFYAKIQRKLVYAAFRCYVFFVTNLLPCTRK